MGDLREPTAQRAHSGCTEKPQTKLFLYLGCFRLKHLGPSIKERAPEMQVIDGNGRAQRAHGGSQGPRVVAQMSPVVSIHTLGVGDFK